MTGSHHLYVHVPFCRLVCGYCDFVTVGGRTGAIPRYVDALLAELAMRPPGGELRTIYLGGGTPSLLPADAVARIVAAARRHWRATDLEEVTLEANPSAREQPDWPALLDAGVTRISLGVQSLRDPQLATLARGHDAAEALRAYRAARAAGATNVGIDLIYAIPGQSLDDWRDGLRRALAIEPDHLSLYALQLALAPDEWAAPPRPGALRWRRRLAERQDDGLAAAQYEAAEELLERAGYEHYELSSWALPGRESRHNAAYWDRRPYTGLGAGAHSHEPPERSWNVRDLDAYLGLVAAGQRPLDGAERLDPATRAFDAIALGLRRVAGLDRAALAEEFGADPVERHADAVEEGQRRGLLEVTPGRLRLTPAGRLLANEALVPFVPAPATATP